MSLPVPAPWSPAAASALLLLPAVVASVAGTCGALLARRKWAAWAGLPGAVAALLGWAAMLPPALAWRAALWPRTMPEHLLVPALAIAALAAIGPRLRGRLAWWAPVAAAGLAGWWLAGSPAGRPEFWRVWVSAAVLAWVAVRVVAGQARRAWTIAAASVGGLWAAGAPSVLGIAALVLAAAWTGPALLNARSRLPPALTVAVLLAMADLAVGRLPEGGINGADIACVAALAAPALSGVLERRLGRRFRRLGPAPAMAGAAVLASGAAWLGAAMVGR